MNLHNFKMLLCQLLLLYFVFSYATDLPPCVRGKDIVYTSLGIEENTLNTFEILN